MQEKQERNNEINKIIDEVHTVLLKYKAIHCMGALTCHIVTNYIYNKYTKSQMVEDMINAWDHYESQVNK